MKRSYVIAAGIAVALAGWLASGQLGADGAPQAARDEVVAAPVMTVRVRELAAESVSREVVVNARTEPARMANLRAEVSGRVDEIVVPEGSMVAAGDVLVRLDARDRAAQVDWAEALVRQRQIEYDAARQLGEKGFQSETRVAEAKALLDQARAELTKARTAFDMTRIRAPFAGVLETVPVEVGDLADVGDHVATVIEQDPFLVVGEVSENRIGNVERGMPGVAELVTGETVAGTVRYVASQADPATRTFTVELEVLNPGERFPAGTTAKLRLQLGEVQAHRISAAQLSLDDAGEIGVKAVADDDTVAFYPAKIVRADADAVWLAGLPETLRLITVGQGFVKPGETVRPAPAEETEATS